MTTITMPKLSDSMEHGTILTWLIDDGQPVGIGDELVEVETDKATQTYEAEAAGTLHIVVPAGASVAVGETIAQVGADASPAVAPVPAPADRDPLSVPADAGDAAADADRQLATPLARRFSAAHGVALADVSGTGPRGRVTRADVLRAIGQPAAVASAGASPRPAALAPDGVTVQVPTRLQRTIARRMVEAKSTIPEFQVQAEVTMDAAIALRAQLKEHVGDRGVVPSFNDMVVKAAAIALRGHPLANASYRDDRFELHDHINVGVAVASDGALIVPVVRDADRKSLGQIATEARALAARAREGRSSAEELTGGTFTVTNLGMFGMSAITPVINAPQAAILGVGAIRGVLARVDGEIVDRALMTLTLSCDHRILYGADAAGFLDAIRRLIEEPLAMAL